MRKEEKWPVTLKVDIAPKDLKKVVKEGRLMEFVDSFSILAAAQIKTQLVEQLVAASVGLTKVGTAVSIDIGFDVDEPYLTGTIPRPWPWPWPRLSWVAIDTHPVPERPNDDMLRQVVRDEIVRFGKH
jgi:hypothetical protein